MKRIRFSILFVILMIRLAAQTDYYFDSTPFTTYGEFHSTPAYTTTNGGHTIQQLLPSQSIRFFSNTTSVSINSYTSTAAGRTYILRQRWYVSATNKGPWVRVGSVVIPATGSGSYSTYNLATGLSSTPTFGTAWQYDLYCAVPIAVSGNESGWYDQFIELDTGSLATIVSPPRPVYCGYGDSRVNGSNGHLTDINSALIKNTDARYMDLWQSLDAGEKAVVIAAVAGGKVVNTGRDGTAAIPASVDGVVTEYGINDTADFPAGTATFQTAYGVMIDNIRTQIGSNGTFGVKPIICLEPFPQASSPQRFQLGTLIPAAVSGKANVSYWNTDLWGPTTTDYLPDGTHENIMAYNLIASFEFPVFGGLTIGSNPGRNAGAVSAF